MVMMMMLMMMAKAVTGTHKQARGTGQQPSGGHWTGKVQCGMFTPWQNTQLKKNDEIDDAENDTRSDTEHRME